MRIVIALGGNALLPRGATPDTAIQVAKVRLAVASLIPLAQEHELVLTHGNGPQVGLLAAATASAQVPADAYPLDTLVAQTQGMIGFWILQALADALPGRQVAGLLTRVLVDADDPAMSRPTKFVGAVLTEYDAQHLASERAWSMARDGRHWRRVVPSPTPRQVLEAGSVRTLLDAGAVVVCTGGGGVPVRAWPDGTHEGVEAVVDKDLASAVLARQIGADLLVILTDVPGVVAGYGTPEARLLDAVTPAGLRDLGLPAGSMGPKAEAAASFVEATGGRAVIGSLGQAEDLVAGRAGTQVRLGPGPALS
ncbi:carbamate kinase [Actinomyces sp. HMT897]|uniref:carbamate kinase n=1 Tax=Actinomyces sp. HMT897 TaxID=2789424 RepID=UPI001909ED20|nr:carbamate kinase [Actinomyces sp. HMT897]QQO78264.1 carbamate kinase [Actinomyces sp. HMT897]